jgi:dihydrodipicolinate synthase/N-acetylneuraminate lyase
VPERPEEAGGRPTGATLTGVYPILSTPFDEARRIDVESLGREVEYLVAAGVDGVGLGLASEVPLLAEEERDLLLRSVVAQARGRVKVVMKSDAPGTDLALRYSRRAAELGADALMVMPPGGAAAEEVRAYFFEIAAAVPLPLFMQDVPAAPVPPALAAGIAREREHPWYLKAESPPTVPRVAHAVAAAEGRLVVFGGAHGAYFPEELRRGSLGTMPGSVVPEAYVGTWRLWRAGREAEARAHFARYGTLLRLFQQQTGIGTHLVKEALRLQGIFAHAVVRAPAVRPDAIALTELREELEMLGVELPGR